MWGLLHIYGSKVWHSTSKYRRTIWQCNHKFKYDKKCQTPHLNEEIIKAAFLEKNINDKRLEHNAKRGSIRTFIRMLEKSDTLLAEFDEELWNAIVDNVTVHSEDEITLTFKDGIELDWNI